MNKQPFLNLRGIFLIWVTACDSYTWDGLAYTTTGAYNNTYTNLAGCDSIHTLNLTISVCGCTDSLANNYNPLATLDDSSCCYVNIVQNDTTICSGDSILLTTIFIQSNLSDTIITPHSSYEYSSTPSPNWQNTLGG